MLAETIKLGSETGGLGHLIRMSQRQGPRAHIYLIILIIPIVAFMIDRFLYWIQRGLFPYKYGGNGHLLHLVRWFIHRWDDLKGLVFSPQPPFDQLMTALPGNESPHDSPDQGSSKLGDSEKRP